MKELKTKTLLIPKELLNKKMSAESIKKLYPYKFEILDSDKLNTTLQNDPDGDYVVYQIIPQTVTTASGPLVPGITISKSAILFKSAIFDVKSGRRMDVQKIKLSLAGSSGSDEFNKPEIKKIVGQIQK